jgi:hypothetical protein
MTPAAIRAEAIPDRTELRLSDSLRLELTVSGPAPLRLEPPKEWLAETSAGLWRIRPLGPARLQDIPDGQRWSQSFRLDPYVPGSPVPLTFNPVSVNDREVDLPSFSITVTTTIAKAILDEARPITGMEGPPPRPVEHSNTTGPAIAIAVAIAIVAMSAAFSLRRRPRNAPEPSPGDLAIAALRQLDPQGPGFAHDLAAILRDWLERGRGLPARSHTVAELRGSNPELDPVLSILDRCERGKYSGERFPPPECNLLRNEALLFVTRTNPSTTEPEQ